MARVGINFEAGSVEIHTKALAHLVQNWYFVAFAGNNSKESLILLSQ